MPSRAGDDRRRTMLEYIRSGGRVEVTELAERLKISPETVRRDLKLCAATTVVSLPVLIAGFAAQDKLVQGLSLGAVK